MPVIQDDHQERYLRFDLGNLAGHALNCTPTLNCGFPNFDSLGKTSSTVRGHIARAVLSYNFGGIR